MSRKYSTVLALANLVGSRVLSVPLLAVLAGRVVLVDALFNLYVQPTTADKKYHRPI